MRMLPWGPPSVGPVEIIDLGGGSYNYFPVNACALLSATRGAYVTGYADSFDLKVTIIDPTEGRIVDTIRVPASGAATRTPDVSPGGLSRIDDTTLALVFEEEFQSPVFNISAARIQLDGTVDTIGPYTYAHTQEASGRGFQDTGGSYFDFHTNTFHSQYWSHYFGSDRSFIAWHLAVDFDAMRFRELGSVRPGAGFNQWGAVGYYGTLALPTLGGAIGCIDPGADVLPSGASDGTTMQVIDNHGNLLDDDFPFDPGGNYGGQDRFMTQVAGGDDVGLIYTRWNPDLAWEPGSGRPNGDFEVWCRLYQVQPSFARRGEDVKLGRVYSPGHETVPEMDPLETALLTALPYDVANYLNPRGAISPISGDFDVNLIEDQAMLVPYTPYRPRADTHRYVKFGPGDRTLYQVSPEFAHLTIGLTARQAALNSLNGLTMMVMTQQFGRSPLRDDFQTVAQVFVTVPVETLRLHQRDDGRAPAGAHARLGIGANAARSTQLGRTPRIGTNNRYS